MTLATKTPVSISQRDFQTMLSFARAAYQLKSNPTYLSLLAEKLPETAKVNHDSPSMLMGYDFHLTDAGPKLIEINNNAGGLWEKDDGWVPQCSHPELPMDLPSRLLGMFKASWQHIAIVDDYITQQYMYPEMQAYASLLEADGRKVSLVSPEELNLKGDGLYVQGSKVDMIYNRHTDFYLDTEVMRDIRTAYLATQVVLNPYPRSYALIGDKNRMVDWWRDGFLESCVKTEALNLFRNVVPETHVFAEYDKDQAWKMRKQWVFKPAARHGGKGVLLGKAMSRKRFDALEASSTVMQKLVPPSLIQIDDVSYKFDIRLYMHGERLIAMAGRAWRGQITNFREEGSGWTSIVVGT